MPEPKQDFEYMNPDNLNWADLVAPSGDQTSEEIDLKGFALVGVVTPPELDSTEATIEVSPDGEVWVPVHNRAGETVTIALAPSRCVALEPAELAGFKRVRLALNFEETAERELKIAVRKLDSH